MLPGDADIDAFLDGSTDEPGQSCNKMQPVRSGMMVMLRAWPEKQIQATKHHQTAKHVWQNTKKQYQHPNQRLPIKQLAKKKT